MAERAGKSIKTIVLPESTDARVIKAASMVCEKGFADIIMLGDEDRIKAAAGDIDISKVRIVDYLKTREFYEYVLQYYEMRKAKGISAEDAKDKITNPLYFGAMMVKMGKADGMVAGAVNPTPDTLRPALEIIKTKEGTKLVSSFLVISVPDCEYGFKGNFIFSDCGMMENPTADELAEIAIASANSFRMLFNEEPKVAMLSYSTYGSTKSPYAQKVVEATRIAKEKAPDIMIDGELQADAAIVPAVAEFKAKGSHVAGAANVLIFPELFSGNIACKLVERLAKAKLFGPILQGLNKPVNDLSRGCCAEDIVGAIAITAVQAQYNEQSAAKKRKQV